MGRKKKQPLTIQASEDALETLVQQFSQPLAFLRELIQNSLDARTNRVEVEIGYEEAEGCARIRVTDHGEGMTREVIETQLTRLFSSSKEGDLTRIGKFGIGFVSVFATRPRAVVVDTGRDGEFWRVLFREDRTYELLSRHEPIEGTQVTSYLPMPRSKLARLERDCRATVVFWCKHCDVDILVNGVRINEPFTLDKPAEVRLEVPGSEVVAAPSPSDRPFCGFYNRGLTLLEGPCSPRPGITFKLRSMYLEHTLTRDNVVQDRNYRKALAILDRAITTLVPRRLLESLAERGDDEHLSRLAAAFFQRYPRVPPECREIRALPSHAGPLALADLERARRVACASTRDDLVESLLEQGIPVLHDQPHARELLRSLGVQLLPASEHWFLAWPAEPEEILAELLATAERLLPGPPLRAGRFPEARHQAICLAASTPGRAEPVAGKKSLRLVNAEHPLVRDLAEIARRDAPLAGYLLARALLLSSGSSAERKLLERAVKLRRTAWA